MFVEVTCPRCSSPRVDRVDPTHYRCQHCHALFVANAPAAHAGVPPTAPVAPLAVGAAPRSRSTSAPIVIAVAVGAALLVAIAVIAGAVVFVARKSPSKSSTRPPVVVATTTPPRAQDGPAPVPPKARIRSSKKGGRGTTHFWIVTYENAGETPIGTPRARVSLFDASGRRVVEQVGHAVRKHLGPGESTPILVLAMNAPTFARAEIAAVEPDAPSAYDAGQTAIEVVDFQASKSGLSHTNLTGTVKNTSPTRVRFVEIVATGLDADGEVVGYATTFATDKEIAAGGASGFKLSSGTFDAEPPTKYRLFAVAMPAR